MKKFHINNNDQSDIGQYLTLMPDGKWVTGRIFDIQPASIRGCNTEALAIEMLVNFDRIGDLPYNDLGYDKSEGNRNKKFLN
ncbi:hypothetical protein ACF3M2_18700 [Tissierella carlieri]|uniref:hypothetical protein n=1 Tax=Tissierella carlieri TaxID=689904 RepID=UPI003862FE88